MRNGQYYKADAGRYVCSFGFRLFYLSADRDPHGWGGMTGKIYIGHAFILLSALILGAKYGALTGAIGLSTCRHFSRLYHISTADFFSQISIGTGGSLYCS